MDNGQSISLLKIIFVLSFSPLVMINRSFIVRFIREKMSHRVFFIKKINFIDKAKHHFVDKNKVSL